MTSNSYTQERFIFVALDPIHIGTGETRIGRVDNTIVRETGSNIPKIPGSSLMGATRQYSAFIYGRPEAAGLHKKLTKEDKEFCPIIHTFGTASDITGGQQGKVSISDAQILFFPVYSMAGPVWISTFEILTTVGLQIKVNDQITNEDPIKEKSEYLTSFKWPHENLNLGWLQLNQKISDELSFSDITDKKELHTIKDRIVLVSSNLFSEIVNNNLETRTSVAIDPDTGSAEEGALFTYEAIPRTTWFWVDVIEDDYIDEFKETTRQFSKTGSSADKLITPWKRSLDVVKSGFELISTLGIGGMSTRGFGRINSIANWEVNNDNKS